MIDKILDTANGELIPFEGLMAKIQDADVIYLAEKHDNPRHHSIQQKIIQRLCRDNCDPILGFEFFSVYDTAVLMTYVDAAKSPHPKMKKKTKGSAMPKKHGKAYQRKMEKRLRSQLEWENQSDDMWKFYYDLLKLAKANKLQAAGLDLTSAQKKRILRRGMEQLTQMEKNYIFSTGYENPQYAAHMKEIFKQVHCGMGNPAMLDKQYQTWLARNDTMARSITQLSREKRKGPVVVIVGGGHTVHGLGIVDRVAHLNPQLSQVILGLTEVSAQGRPAEDYLTPLELEGFDPTPPGDFLWFTPRVSNGDPCKKFKKMLERMKGDKNPRTPDA
ncbi:MAG: ChaN family lipoprotein [Desulfobacterales bacterium]|nr:ChaN family lipoprotein [Desulfobacterales bacterium]